MNLRSAKSRGLVDGISPLPNARWLVADSNEWHSRSAHTTFPVSLPPFSKS